MKSEKKLLFKNTLMMYIMRFSTYFFGFISVPYQTRILGPDMYGKIALAMALMVYFQLIIDFGFILSGTQEVARNSDDRSELKRIYSSIQYLKFGLIMISFIVLTVFCLMVKSYRDDYLFYFLFFVGTAINGLLPDYVYRGIQEMSAVTYRIIISRTIFTALIFVFLRKPSDYMIIPVINAFGNLVAFVWSILYLKKTYNIHLVKVDYKTIKSHMLMSGSFFLSRIVGTVYTSMNLMILNYVTPISKGYYAVADKLFSTGQQALSPISDSVYPYMVKNKDFKLVNKILIILMPVIIIFCSVFYIYAEKMMVFIFGADYASSGEIIRSLLPAAVATLPDYLYGFPVMSGLNITKHANYSVYISSGIHIIILLIAFRTGNISAVFLARLISFTTIIDLIYRVIIVRICWKKYNKDYRKEVISE
ncbi:oligosaccharide flippase family protein [Helcococcus bovis]|uniref:oligosaccharide flippase family protein n=1 Tax=Helcococcus bovis TaxID=3153252 RepID=UPI0038B875B1